MDYFNKKFTKLRSDSDHEIHTVIPGRLVGITPELTQALAQHNIHIYIYTENYHDFKMGYLFHLRALSPDHIHLHSHCIPENWVEEFSQYDAGWLHCFDSNNKHDLQKANWEDLNIPARLTTLAMAGLPMIQKNNFEHTVAMQSIARERNVGVFFKDAMDLCNQLKDTVYMNSLRENLRQQRYEFSFDYHVPELIEFFRNVIKQKAQAASC